MILVKESLFNRFNRVFISLAVMAFSSLNTFAEQKGTSTAQFLRIGQGARAEGMGGAFTAIANDVSATYWNPAGLAQVTKKQFGFNHLEFIEDISSQNIGLVIPVNGVNGSLGANITYVDMGTIIRRDANNASDSGDSDVNAYSATLAWGQALGSQFALGGGVKFLNQNLAGEEDSGIAIDIGALFYPVPDKFSIGLAFQNIGSKLKVGTREEDLPQTIRVGGAYHVVPGEFVIAVDGEKEKGTDTTLHGGVEYSYQRTFVARFGYQDTHEAKGGFSAGIGFIWRPSVTNQNSFFSRNNNQPQDEEGMEIRFDYGFVDLGDFDSTHRIGITLAL